MTLIEQIFSWPVISFAKKRILFTAIILLIVPVKIFSQDGLVKTYYPDDTLKSAINYSNKVRQGEAKFYYPNGRLRQEMTYENGMVSGLVKIYNESGNLKEMFNTESGRREGPATLFDSTGKFLNEINYENGMLVKDEAPAEVTAPESVQPGNTAAKEKSISAENIKRLKNKAGIAEVPPSVSENKNESIQGYVADAEIMPEPEGGMKTIMDKLVYPALAKEEGVQGEVKVKAFVDEYGEVTHAEVIKGIGHGCDEAAKIAVFYTKFNPGIVKGKPVNAQVIIPVEFKLKGK